MRLNTYFGHSFLFHLDKNCANSEPAKNMLLRPLSPPNAEQYNPSTCLLGLSSHSLHLYLVIPSSHPFLPSFSFLYLHVLLRVMLPFGAILRPYISFFSNFCPPEYRFYRRPISVGFFSFISRPSPAGRLQKEMWSAKETDEDCGGSFQERSAYNGLIVQQCKYFLILCFYIL